MPKVHLPRLIAGLPKLLQLTKTPVIPVKFSTTLANTFGISDSKNAQETMRYLNEDLGVLITIVSSFVDWWGDMKQSLSRLTVVIPRIKPDGSNSFRTESVTEEWQTVRNDYDLYRTKVCHSNTLTEWHGNFILLVDCNSAGSLPSCSTTAHSR
jgi:hypothetical protein